MSAIPIDSQDTLNLGENDAPHQLTVVMNLSCRYCKKWWSRNAKNIEAAIAGGRLSLHIKFWTKDKAALRIGNVAHEYVDFAHPQAAFAFVQRLVQNQNHFKRYSIDQVPKYLELEYGVSKHNTSKETQQTTRELSAAGVRGIPTIVLDGEWHDIYEYRLPKL